jgi:hypothetical protein
MGNKDSYATRILAFALVLIVIVLVVWIQNPLNDPTVKNTVDPIAEIAQCEGSMETFFLGFNSHMKQADFDKELSSNSSLINGRNPMEFDGHTVEFNIKPAYNKNGCLSSVELYAEVQFGSDALSDKEELDFCNSMLGLFQMEYGQMTVQDSLADNLKNAEGRCLNQTMEAITGQPIEALTGKPYVTYKTKIPAWVCQHAYFGTGSRISSDGNLYINDPYNLSNRVQASSYELDLEKQKAIDILTSARYRYFKSADELVHLQIVTSYYSHQDGYSLPKQNTSVSSVRITYYSKRYYAEVEAQNNTKKSTQMKEQIKRDSLAKTNGHRF